MIHPNPQQQSRARLKSLEDYQAAYRRSLEQPEAFWRDCAERLTWSRRPTRILDVDMKSANFAWYEDGELNVSVNCVDRHAARTPDRVAIIWAKDEPGEYERVTYRELQGEVCRLANVLLAHGVRRGDRVCIYMPMMPLAAAAMLACARIGAVHSVVFAGFSAESLRDRINDCGCKVVLTANEAVRGGKRIPLKQTVDEALSKPTPVERVLVARRTALEAPMREGRDLWLDTEMARHRAVCPAEDMPAEAPLFILYTSGSTGKPKGVLHTTGGYLVYAALSHELVFDHHEGDVYCCAADIGWVTGHSYVVYGPLANGATTVMFESTPLYPDAGRYWRMVDDLGVTIFYTAPTALRAIAREGDAHVTKYRRSSLRVLGSVGEPINPDIWSWYHEVVGAGRCAVVDTFWQTETGGVVITPLAGATPTKPGSATLPFLGIEPVLMDAQGREIAGNDVSGNLCLRGSWPGQARTLFGDHRRFVDTYFKQYPGLYFTGDGCRRDEDGFYWITGRVDDVINVSGHRLGTAEIESALVAHEAVAEAAVVGVPHDIKGTGIYAYVQLTPEAERAEAQQLILALREQVGRVIGKLAIPDRIQLARGLPKTRSGKIMRRILRKIAEGRYDELGDVTTLADPEVVKHLVEAHRAGR